VSALTESPAWRRLQRAAEAIRQQRIHDLFSADPTRVDRLSSSASGITLDASRNLVTAEAFTTLLDLAREADVAGWRERLFAGERINTSEQRAALHPALRLPELADVAVDGAPVGDTVTETRRRMAAIVAGVRDGSIRSADGEPFRAVVNIGIGGSDLGPRLVCNALPAAPGAPTVHFVANIDPVGLERVWQRIDAKHTLFIVASKTFTTLETLTNARMAYQGIEAAGVDDPAAHFVAVTGARECAENFGISADRILDLPEWVGGRYSVWSAVGLPVALAAGQTAFDELLAGAAAMDRHFREAEPEASLPLKLALVGIWHGNLLGARSHVVVPYAERLSLLPEYLQQLELESNGKSVDRDGHVLDHPTVPALWGAVGTNAQHAFFQWLHQGTERASCDLIVVRGAGDPAADALAANGLAQGAALLQGVDDDLLAAAGVAPEQRPHRRLPGSRSSTTLLLDDLAPHTLGALLALYEHKVFCQAMIWRINPFDQWGVERGKVLAGSLTPALAEGEVVDGLDASTQALVERYRKR